MDHSYSVEFLGAHNALIIEEIFVRSDIRALTYSIGARLGADDELRKDCYDYTVRRISAS